jgi:hypothetical protein
MPNNIGVEIVRAEPAAVPQSNTRSWKVFAQLINTSWRKGVDAFLDTGRYLLEAKAELGRDVFESLVKQHLDFDTSVGRKLMAIASNSVICAHGHKLPPCWTTIYELSKLDDEVLTAKFADGTIHSGMARKDASALRTSTGKSPARVSGESNEEEETLAACWKRASKDDRRAFLDEIGVQAILEVMSAEFGADLRARVPAPKRKSGKPFKKTLNLHARERASGFRH